MRSKTNEQHQQTVARLGACKTKAEQSKIESQTGFRNTALLKLPYFNPSRMLVIDPMHNLFLGTAKHILRDVWLKQNTFTLNDFLIIQSRIDRTVVPSTIGRIPHKIATGFASFTADQFKNWVLYFSLLVLRDKLNGADLECWRHFVLGCRLFVKNQFQS